MIAINKLTENIKTYIVTQIDTMSKSTPMINFMKPLITRALNNNFNKVTKALDLIADENGRVENIQERNLTCTKLRRFVKDIKEYYLLQ